MPALDRCVPPAFADLWPDKVPTHIICIVEFYDPDTDSVELGNIVDDDLRTWSALGMVSVAQSELAHAMHIPTAEGDD